MTEIVTGKITTDNHILQLLALQQKNLKKNISDVEMKEQGFVTVEHDFDKIKSMNASLPQIAAFNQNIVVGYALSMPLTFKNIIPELTPMCELLEELEYGGKSFKEYKYYIMGQICIDKSAREIAVLIPRVRRCEILDITCRLQHFRML